MDTQQELLLSILGAAASMNKSEDQHGRNQIYILLLQIHIAMLYVDSNSCYLVGYS
jgi:hypothetical protein